MNKVRITLFLACMAPIAAWSEDNIDCVKNTSSKIVCSISPERSGRVRLKASAQHTAKDQAPAFASIRVQIDKRAKPCAQENDVPIAGTGAVEAVCDLHMMKSHVYTVTAISTSKNTQPSDITLDIAPLRKQKSN